MKIYMHWDMEGASGIFTRAQTWYWEPGVSDQVKERGRQLLMADINAAVAASLDAGAGEVIICDTHHGGGNIRIEEMLADPRVTYHTRSVREEHGFRRWMPDLDASVDAFMLPGHHAKRGTPDAFLPHGWSREWEEITINGESVGEIGLEACYAAHWGVPLVLVQGDVAACREAEARFPGVVTAAVKQAVTPELCDGLDLPAAHQLTAEKIHEAIAKTRQQQIPVVRPQLPMTVAIRMTTPEAAETAAKRSGVSRVDERTVAARLERYGDVVSWIVGVGAPAGAP
jgi:D-amino peptidase